jgi:3-oxoacyl-[acyl-carrier protein] reductase
MDISLKGKEALICGSTQGIGLAVAVELALCGANCTLFARNEMALKEAVDSLDVSAGQQHGYIIADFSNFEEVKKAVSEHLTKKEVHILINNTGGPKSGAITDAKAENFINAFQQHLVNNHLLVQAVMPSMKAAGYGRIINIISTSVRIPLKNLGVSNTIRAAVASWSKSLSNEIGKFGITVNSVLPGFTDTKRLEEIIEITAGQQSKDKEKVIAEMHEQIPLQRFGEAKEIAAVVAFLASPAASYVHGVSIPVDGGRTGTI